MSAGAPVSVVTGAFSYTGSDIAARLLADGERVRTLSRAPDPGHPALARARDAVELGRRDDDVTADAAGPDTLTFAALVRLVRAAIGARCRTDHKQRKAAYWRPSKGRRAPSSPPSAWR